MRKKRRKSKLYFSSKKAFEFLGMRTASKEFNFRNPSILLSFRNTYIVDIADVIDGVFQAIQEVEEMMISNVNEAKCTT